MTEAESIVLQALPRREIRARLSRYLPMVLIAALVYFVFIAGGLYFLFNQWLNQGTSRLLAVCSASLVVVIGSIWYVKFVLDRLARCQMKSSESSMIVLLQSSTGFQERSFELSKIQKVIVGASLNFVEQGFDRLNKLGVPTTSMAMVKDLKAGRLTIQEKDKEPVVFHFLDKVFAPDDLAAHLAFLHARGVPIEVGR